MIPVLKPKLPTAEELLPRLRKIDQNRWYSNYGPLVKELEAKLNERWPTSHLTTVCNATIGLTLALNALNLPEGSYCIVPSWTFTASVLAIYQAKLIPFFVDVDLKTQTPLVSQVEKAVQDHQVSSLMVVCPFGAPVDVSFWESLAQRLNIQLVFDAAASFDSWQGSKAPAVISLHATKILGAGEGGIVLSSSEKYIREVRSMTVFGFTSPERTSQYLGQNAKLSEYHAAVALTALDSYERDRDRLRLIANLYKEHLDGLSVSFQEGFGDKWLSLTLIVSFDFNIDIVELEKDLSAKQIQTRRWWNLCHLHSAFNCKGESGDFANSYNVYSRSIGLPFYIDLDTSKLLTRLYNVLEVRHP